MRHAAAALLVLSLLLGLLLGGYALFDRRGSPALRRAVPPRAPSPARVEAAAAARRDFEVVRRSYAESVEALDAERRALGKAWMEAGRDPESRSDVLREARGTVLAAVRDELVPAWLGTTWAYSGTSEQPGQGSIACGYFVSTVLRDAGFRVERRKLAQQASERIVRTFAVGDEVRRYRKRPRAEVVRDLKGRGAGLYLVGLDHHVGLIVVEEEREPRMCHSSVLWPGTVVCEPAAGSRAMVSAIHVVGPVLTDRVLERWLEGKGLPTAG